MTFELQCRSIYNTLCTSISLWVYASTAGSISLFFISRIWIHWQDLLTCIFSIDRARVASKICCVIANVFDHTKGGCYHKYSFFFDAWIEGQQASFYRYLLHTRVGVPAKHLINRIPKSIFSCVTWPWASTHGPIETYSDCDAKGDFLYNKINRL